MLCFEIERLDQVSIHADRRGLNALMSVLSSLNDDIASQKLVLEVGKGACRLSAKTPFAEAGVRVVTLNFVAATGPIAKKRTKGRRSP
jgi:hypothetical protein